MDLNDRWELDMFSIIFGTLNIFLLHQTCKWQSPSEKSTCFICTKVFLQTKVRLFYVHKARCSLLKNRTQMKMLGY